MALTAPPSNQKVMILGFSTTYIKESKIEKSKTEDIKKIALSMKYQSKTKVICLFE